MFRSKKDANEEYDCTDDFKAILQTRNLKIAISRSEVRAGYGFPMHPSPIMGNSYEISTETDLLGSSGLLRGVIHITAYREHHIPATVRFRDASSLATNIGEASLARRHMNENNSSIGDPSKIHQKHHLDVTINDKDLRMFDFIRQSMRDACLSNNNFLHVDFVLAQTNIASWFSNLKSNSAAKVPVTSIHISDAITLPLAPTWSWNWY